MEPRIHWEDTPSLCARQIETALGLVNVRRGRFAGRTSDGVELVEVDTGAVAVSVLPTRGMGIWKMRAAGLSFGWQSPVPGPVHPALVPLSDPGGLGWLEGFDEMLVRCGLESNGAAELTEQGVVRWPLHGRIANLPATRLAVEIDPAAGRVTLIGEVIEARFLFKRLRLTSRLSVVAGRSDVEVNDEVTNDFSEPATAQMLYHINMGTPLLSEGAQLLASPESLEPKDDRSRAELDRWSRAGAPQPGFAERVYFMRLRRDEQGQSAACLRSADGDAGFGLTYDATTLPYFTFWRHTRAIEDGYVVGMEPATNFPHTRSAEAAAGRVVPLAPKQSVTFRLRLHPLVGRPAVDAFRSAHQLS